MPGTAHCAFLLQQYRGEGFCCRYRRRTRRTRPRRHRQNLQRKEHKPECRTQARQAGQYLGTDGSYYYGFGVISAEGQFIEDSSGTISLGPVILKNGQIAIGFIGIKETDPMGFGLMAYTDEFMDEVYTYKAILDCVLYK